MKTKIAGVQQGTAIQGEIATVHRDSTLTVGQATIQEPQITDAYVIESVMRRGILRRTGSELRDNG